MTDINIMVIEDSTAESDALLKVLHANHYHVTGVARNYAEALQLFYAHKTDIVIIDIFLNGNPDGINFAETLNTVPEAARPFVFLTSSNDRQIFERAKLTHPFSFLMKPFNELEILYAIEMAVEKFYKDGNAAAHGDPDTVISKEYVFIKKNRSLRKVFLSDILYIEVEEKYCNIVTEQEKFLVLISLNKISQFLDTEKFIRTHRNYIANKEKITEIILSDNLIVLGAKHHITLSDTYKDFVSQFRILK